MKTSKDNFSEQSAAYKKFRPVYPAALYEEILSHFKQRERCWDCGTGNGQVAVALAPYFKQIHATDLSENQLKQATQLPNIIYEVQRAEKTKFPDRYFDLITVAQAIHWFDHDAFGQEVQRVLKPGGILAVWGYGLLRISEHINPIIDDFYTNTVGKYWDAERKHVDNHYADIQMNLESIDINQSFSISTSWNRDEFEGYLNTWSSVRHYKKANKTNPVGELMRRISEVWHKDERKEITFPVFLKMWKQSSQIAK